MNTSVKDKKNNMVFAASFVDSVLRYTTINSMRTAYIPIIDQVSHVGMLVYSLLISLD